MLLREGVCYSHMEKGSPFHKLRHNKRFSRVYKLNSSHQYITWYPSRKRGGGVPRIAVKDIKRVKRGVNPSRSQVSSSALLANHSFTIFTHATTIELVSSSVEVADTWLVGLRWLVYRASSHEHTVRGMWLSEEFHLLATAVNPLYRGVSGTTDPAVPNGTLPSHAPPPNKVVDLDSCIRRIKELSYYCSQFSLATLSARDARAISETEFIQMYEFYSNMDPVLTFIFLYNNNGDDYLTAHELGAFVQHEFRYLTQGVDDTYLRTVIEHYEPIPILRAENCMGIDGLITFLLSPDLSLFNPFHTKVSHNMSHPLSHYLINSSHNTFLTGDQLYSASSTDMYTKLLLDGVRHVELDVWDGDDGEPEVYHGYTSTSRLKVKAVLLAIAETAFAASIYPVIVDMENHCCLSQQMKIAHYLRDVFKDALLIVNPVDRNGTVTKIPLNRLCFKVLVKCKKLSADVTRDNFGEVSDENSADELPNHCKTGQGSENVRPSPDVIPSSEQLEEAFVNANQETLPSYDQRRKQHILLGRKPTVALSKYLSSLVSLKSRTLTADHLSQAEPAERGAVYQVNELDAIILVREQYFNVSNFCQQNLVKVVPSPARFNSANPEPIQFWNAGVQMVALNQQTSRDKCNRYNRALFRANGNCGYFLKPLYQAPFETEVLQLDLMFYFVSRIQAFMQSSTPALPSHRWTLQVEIKGHLSDVNTRYIDCMNLPLTPETFTVAYPHMAFFCLTLYEELSKSRKFSCDYVIPVTSIAAGVKTVPLQGPSACVVVMEILARTRSEKPSKKRGGSASGGARSFLAKKTTFRKQSSANAADRAGGGSMKLRRQNSSTPNLSDPQHHSFQPSMSLRLPEPRMQLLSNTSDDCLKSRKHFPGGGGSSSRLKANRSSMHELTMSSIANLFHASTANPSSNHRPVATSSRDIAAAAAAAAGQSDVFAAGSPVYDSPMSQSSPVNPSSLYNSPSHQAVSVPQMDNLPQTNNHMVIQPLHSADAPSSSGYYDSTVISGYQDQSNPGTPANLPYPKFTPGQITHSLDHQATSMNRQNESSSQAIQSRALRQYPEFTSNMQNGRDFRSKLVQPIRNKPKKKPAVSVIRGRLSSLSDTDMFSSDEELPPIVPKTKGDLEDELNLSNLAAEIEEEFRQMSSSGFMDDSFASKDAERSGDASEISSRIISREISEDHDDVFTPQENVFKPISNDEPTGEQSDVLFFQTTMV